MPRLKFQTLTEQMFYILLCLRQERCGIDILELVPAMTNGRVTVGSGTLYNLLEQFLDSGYIRETRVEGRRRSYLLTDEGQEMLILVTELTISYYGAHFISRYGCKEYFNHNKELLFYERQKEIIREIENLELED